MNSPPHASSFPIHTPHRAQSRYTDWAIQSPYCYLHNYRQSRTLPPAMVYEKLHPTLPLRRQGAHTRSRAMCDRNRSPRSHNSRLHSRNRWILLTSSTRHPRCRKRQEAPRKISSQGQTVGAQLRNTRVDAQCLRCVYRDGSTQKCHWKAAA